jgi:hypothetical protein
MPRRILSLRFGVNEAKTYNLRNNHHNKEFHSASLLLPATNEADRDCGHRRCSRAGMSEVFRFSATIGPNFTTLLGIVMGSAGRPEMGTIEPSFHRGRGSEGPGRSEGKKPCDA